MSSLLQLAVNLATEKGTSGWLTTPPLEEYGFALHKSDLHSRMLLLCTMVGSHFAHLPIVSVDHPSQLIMLYLALKVGCHPSAGHNEIRDLTAKLLTEVCSQVATEPELQPVSPEEFSLSTANTQDGARLDIVMNGFWALIP